MSYDQKSYGWVSKVVGDSVDDFSELYERLYNDGSNLGINSDGTIVYLDYMKHVHYYIKTDVYSLSLGLMCGSPNDLIQEAAKYGIQVDLRVVPFNVVWNDGSDHPLDLITLSEYDELSSVKSKA